MVVETSTGQGTPEQLFHQATEHLAAGQMPQALPLLEAVCDQMPDFPGGHYNRGIALFSLGNIETALDAFRRTIELTPSFHQGYLNAGKCALTLNQLEEAVALFGQALELAPDAGGALIGRGLAYYECGDFDLALHDFAQVPADNESFWMAQHYLGCCYLEQNQTTEAIEAFRQSDRVSPGRLETLEMLFLALYSHKDYKQALALHESMVLMDPSVKKRYQEEIRLANKALLIPLQPLVS